MRRLFLHFACIVLPKLLSGVATAAISLMLIRHLSPTLFGMLSLCLSAILIADAVFGSAFDLAAVRLASEAGTAIEGSLAVQWATILLKVGVLGSAAVVVALGYQRVNRWFFHGSATPLVLVLTGMAALSILLLRSAQLNFQLEQRFRVYGVLDLLQSIIKVGGVAVLTLLGVNRPEAFLGLFVAGPLLSFLGWFMMRGRQFPLLSVPVPELRRTAYFARWFLLTFALGTAISRLDLWLVARYTDLRGVGIYSAAQALAIVPVMLGTYLSVVISPRILRLFRSGELLRFTYRMQGFLLLCAGLAYVAAALMLPRLAPVFPGRFHQASPILLLLLPGSLAGMVSFPLTITTLMFLRPRFLLFLDCATAPFIVLSYIFLLRHMGVAGAAFAFSGAALVRATIAQIAALVIIRRDQPSPEPTPKWIPLPAEPSTL